VLDIFFATLLMPHGINRVAKTIADIAVIASSFASTC
jgi:hypothetical protein